MKPVKGRQVDRFDALQKPGDFLWVYRKNDHANPASVYFRCPCGCDDIAEITVNGDPLEGPVWDWDGNKERPTCSPSIRKLDGCQWHGYLRSGVFEPC